MKNKMADVRDHLVAMMELLGEKDATELDIAKAKAISELAQTYTNTVKVELQAREIVGGKAVQLPEALEQPKLLGGAH
ncbi:hypothetical protein [Microcystis phage vB_MaeS-yong1]|nr:hypothetical protein [Microcystis phage vB_MaeS-yong1]